MSESPKPDWYPDPSGQAELRWWDGSQWTEHTHSFHAPPAAHPQGQPQAMQPQGQPVPAAQPVPTAWQAHGDPTQHLLPGDATGVPEASNPAKKKKTWLLVTAGVAALALVTTAAISIPVMLGNQGGAAQTEAVVINGIKYMPPVEIDVSRNKAFSVDANVDLTDLSKELEAAGEPVTYSHGVFDLFADRELSIPVQAFTYSSKNGNHYEWEISPLQSSDRATAAQGLFEEDEPFETTFFNKEVPWSLYSEYWVKQSYDADGKKLEVPEVTRILPKFPEEQLDSVRVSFSKGVEDGSVKVSWVAPEYADKNTEYLLLKAAPSSFGTTEDEWMIDRIAVLKGKTEYDSSDNRPFKSTQNTGLELFSGDSADVQEYGSESIFRAIMNTTKARIGVIVKHDGKYSPIELVEPDSGVRAQPYELASFQMFQTLDETQDWNVGDLTGLNTWLPVTTLDGATRTMQVQIDPESLNPDVVIQNFDDNGGYVYPDGVGMRGTVLGTSLQTTYSSYVPAGMSKAEWMEQLKTHIAAFNERSIAEQNKTGGVLLTVEDADHTIDVVEYRKLPTASKTPKVDYDVFGTHPMVEHIAASMIAGEQSIDVSKWSKDTNAPSPYDAYREAVTQNPIVNYGRPIVAFDRDRIFVDYVFDQKERDAAMQLSHEKAAEIAASVEGMSDTDKVVAINQWVVDHTEYDFESLAAYEGNSLSGITMPMGRIAYDSEFTAWSPIGVFRDGTAVCSGYAQAFTMIAREAGLESIVIGGEVVDAGPHAWNRVKIDGTWKSVDPTWNDSESNPNQYLIINESDYTGSAERMVDANDSWILESNKSKFDTP